MPKSECPDIWIRLPRHKWPKSWSSIKTQFFLNEICTVILWQHCHDKGNLRNSYWNTFGRRFPIGTAYSNTVKKDYFYLCTWMTSKLTGKKQNIDPMTKVLNKEVDLRGSTSFLDHVYLGCTQREWCQISKDIVDNYRSLFESRISAVRTEKSFHTLKIFVSLHGLLIWKVLRRNVWNDFFWVRRTRRLNNSTKYLLHASMTIIPKQKKWNP